MTTLPYSCGSVFRSFAFLTLPLVVVGCSDDVTQPSLDSGAIRVHVFEISGSVAPDLDGYVVSVDNGPREALDSVALFADVEPGHHTVRLEDLAPNCAIVGENPRQVLVESGITSNTVFDIGCTGGYHLQLSFDRLAAGLVVGETQSIEVTSLGETTVTVTTASGVERTFPVVVYDEMVLPVNGGELLIRYADRFEPRGAIGATGWVTENSLFEPDFPFWFGYTQFYHPVTSDGWYALGTLGMGPLQTYEAPMGLVQDYPWGYNEVTEAGTDIDGQQWMLLVKEGDGGGGMPALEAPAGFTLEYKGCGRRWESRGGVGGGRWVVDCAAFWTPVCTNSTDYVALGTVVTPIPVSDGLETIVRTDLAEVPPSVDDVRCVRRDLTEAGEAVTDHVAYGRYAYEHRTVSAEGTGAVMTLTGVRSPWPYTETAGGTALADDEVPVSGSYWTGTGETGLGSFRAWRIAPTGESDTFGKTHLETGTFVGIGAGGSTACTSDPYGTGVVPLYWSNDFDWMNSVRPLALRDNITEGSCYDPGMVGAGGLGHVLSVDLPLLVDVEE